MPFREAIHPQNLELFSADDRAALRYLFKGAMCMTAVHVPLQVPVGLNVRVGAPRLSWTILVLVLFAHAVVFAALSTLKIDAVTLPQAMQMVNVIAAEPSPEPEVPAPKQEIIPPQPKPVAKQERPEPVAAAPVLAVDNSKADAPAQVEKIVPTEPLPTIQTPVQSTPAPAPAAAPAVATTAAKVDADYLDNPKPVYPPLSRKAGEQGRVVLRVFVEASGAASKVEVSSSSGFERLDRSAANAVSRWKFVPARQGMEAVAAWVLVPIVFSLKE